MCWGVEVSLGGIGVCVAGYVKKCIILVIILQEDSVCVQICILYDFL